MRCSGNTIVITGGASGIGLAIARAFLARENQVIAVGRSTDKLNAAKAEAPGLQTLACDITDEASLRLAMERIAADHPRFNILVNAAGISRACRFAQDEGAIELARAEINTNLLGTVMATKLALSHLFKQPEAAVVTISSGIALAPHLGEPTHSATKAALHAFCRCLRAQLKGTSVKVFEVMPPLTDTALTKTVKGKKLRPEDVANAVVAGVERDNYEIRVGIVKALAFLARLSPALAARIVTGSAQ
jgi:short-subunit dehydrogenase involved in D-alanine esterification of teichoic acids